MNKVRIGINGFGRIGRNALKVAFEHRDQCEVVGINDLTDTRTLALLLKHDTAYGEYGYEVSFDDKGLVVDGKHIPVFAEKEPAALPWGALDTDIVIESTGRFLDSGSAGAHLQAGAKRVIISAPSKAKDGSPAAPMHVLGVNPSNGEEEVVSNASCTTNSIAPVMAVLEEVFGIEMAMLSTVHAYTASQALQDAPSKDLREARAAGQNIVPTSTGAAVALTETMPQLKGRFDGVSFRVPVIVVSLSDVTVVLKQDVTVEAVNKALVEASQSERYAGILDVSDQPLVSSDFRGNPHSSIVDLEMTRVVNNRLVKVVCWYDNEWGYSNRLVEQAIAVGRAVRPVL